MISIIIPFINEKNHLSDLISQLHSAVEYGHEIILVDGGSSDGFSLEDAVSGSVLLKSIKGRAKQMNTGAAAAKGDVFWFLHADSILEQGVMNYINLLDSLEQSWGRFNIRLSGEKYIFTVISTMINRRSSLSGIATGDQGIFVTRKLFDAVRGYDEIDIMEDIAFSKKLKKVVRPINMKMSLRTSSRRWQEKGTFNTILLMWRMRFLFFVGVKPSRLIKMYEK